MNLQYEKAVAATQTLDVNRYLSARGNETLTGTPAKYSWTLTSPTGTSLATGAAGALTSALSFTTNGATAANATTIALNTYTGTAPAQGDTIRICNASGVYCYRTVELFAAGTKTITIDAPLDEAVDSGATVQIYKAAITLSAVHTATAYWDCILRVTILNSSSAAIFPVIRECVDIVVSPLQMPGSEPGFRAAKPAWTQPTGRPESQRYRNAATTLEVAWDRLVNDLKNRGFKPNYFLQADRLEHVLYAYAIAHLAENNYFPAAIQQSEYLQYAKDLRQDASDLLSEIINSGNLWYSDGTEVKGDGDDTRTLGVIRLIR
jgi:hypothetical protein